MDPRKRLCHGRMFVVLGSIHTNAFSKVYVLNLAETIQNIFIHTGVFKSLHFHLFTLETKRFRNDASPLLKPFSKVSVFIRVFGRFSVDDRRERLKMYAFSNKNVLV